MAQYVIKLMPNAEGRLGFWVDGLEDRSFSLGLVELIGGSASLLAVARGQGASLAVSSARYTPVSATETDAQQESPFYAAATDGAFVVLVEGEADTQTLLKLAQDFQARAAQEVSAYAAEVDGYPMTACGPDGYFPQNVQNGKMAMPCRRDEDQVAIDDNEPGGGTVPQVLFSRGQGSVLAYPAWSGDSVGPFRLGVANVTALVNETGPVTVSYDFDNTTYSSTFLAASTTGSGTVSLTLHRYVPPSGGPGGQQEWDADVEITWSGSTPSIAVV